MLLQELTSDLLGELYTHVDTPLILRLTCRALRDGHAPQTVTKVSHVVASTSLLEWAFRDCALSDKCTIGTLSYLAIAGGHVNSLEWMRANARYVCGTRCGAVAARNGQLAVLQWLDAQNCKLDRSTADYAAEEGHVKCMKWAMRRGCKASQDTLVGAARGGHLNCLRFLIRSGTVTLSSYAMGAAASNGHVEAMQLLTKNACPFNKWMTVDAASSGDLDCLEYALGFFPVWEMKEICLRDAAAFGKAHIARWLLERASFDYDDVDQACGSAAYYGRIPVLEVLHSFGHDFSNEEHCTAAAGRGNVAVLKWLIDHGAVLDASDLYRCAVEAANREGQVLRWLEAQPAWDTRQVCLTAASLGNLHVLKWVVAECQPELRKEFCHAAAHWGHRKLLKWLLRRMCPYDIDMFPKLGRCSARRIIARGAQLASEQHLGECLSD